MLPLLLTLAHADATLSPALDAAFRLIETHGTLPLPALDRATDRRLRSGSTITSVTRRDGYPSVLGLRIVHAPTHEVWAALEDSDVLADPAVTERLVSTEANGDEIWYGRMALPLMLSDRQWLVRTRVNQRLHRSSGQTAYERSWTELPGAEQVGTPGAITIQRNRGAWQVVDLGKSRSLLAYQASTELGGDVPGWVVQQVAVAQVGRVLDRVAGATERVATP